MLVLLVAMAFVVVSPAFSFEAAGESSYKSVGKSCCPSTKAETKKADCDECKDCECTDCCKDGECECKDDDCDCSCKKSSCSKSKSSCGK